MNDSEGSLDFESLQRFYEREQKEIKSINEI